MKFSIHLLLGLAATTFALAADNRTAASVRQSLAVDGVVCPEVLSWYGGDPFGILGASPGGGASAKKQITAIGYDPIVIETTLPLSPALAECVADLLANRATPRSLLLTTQKSSGAGSTVQATEALLTELRFPALDGASKEPLRLTLAFRAASTSPAAPSPNTEADAKPRKTAALASNFRVSITGLPTARIARIEPFAITRPPAEKNVGAARNKTGSASAVIPDLSLHFGEADLAAWADWRDRFLIKGDNADSAEKDGTLEILGPDLKTPLLTLKLSNLGLLRLSVPPANGERIVRARADVYCETMSVLPEVSKTSGKDATR